MVLLSEHRFPTRPAAVRQKLTVADAPFSDKIIIQLDKYISFAVTAYDKRVGSPISP